MNVNRNDSLISVIRIVYDFITNFYETPLICFLSGRKKKKYVGDFKYDNRFLLGIENTKKNKTLSYSVGVLLIIIEMNERIS
jgi:hypothetical protein